MSSHGLFKTIFELLPSTIDEKLLTKARAEARDTYTSLSNFKSLLDAKAVSALPRICADIACKK